MQSPQDIRDDLLKTLAHLRSASTKVIANSGPKQILSAPDVHKIAEGLFLCAVTHWEQTCQALVRIDLATAAGGVLCKDVASFRGKNAPYRIAELIVSHIDHPEAFFDWSDFGKVCARADRLLPKLHRFAPPPPVPPATKSATKTALAPAVVDELALFKRIRNAIAHKSDRAWSSFMKLVAEPPFSLASNQRKGITPGRLLTAHKWAGSAALLHSFDTLEGAAKALVP